MQPKFRVIRHVGDLDGQRRSKEVAYCVTSLAPGKADAKTLGEILRGRCGAIENGVHWVRDVTFNEDASILRTGTAPHTMAIIRNTLIATFRLTGWTNLKRARRHFSHTISRCIDLITKPLKTKHQHDGALGHHPKSNDLARRSGTFSGKAMNHFSRRVS
jgi:hypothetical protein